MGRKKSKQISEADKKKHYDNLKAEFFEEPSDPGNINYQQLVYQQMTMINQLMLNNDQSPQDKKFVQAVQGLYYMVKWYIEESKTAQEMWENAKKEVDAFTETMNPRQRFENRMKLQVLLAEKRLEIIWHLLGEKNFLPQTMGITEIGW